MNTAEDFENAPLGATATLDDGSRAMKMVHDGEQRWMTQGWSCLDDKSIVRWGYMLDAPAPTTAREALDLAWDLAHPVKEGQVTPKGTRVIDHSGGTVVEYIAGGDWVPRDPANFRTLEPLPEPEPDWLDAPAVLAVHDSYTAPSIWGKHWDQEGSAGIYQSALTTGSAHWSELRDVTPLYPREDQS